MKSVFIIGSGLLGLSLAEKFFKNGYLVSITTTTEGKLFTLQNQGYNPIIFNSDEIEHYEQLTLIKSDVLVFALSPSKCKVFAYNDVLKNICNKLNLFNVIVFTSSTSVYSNNGQPHTEKSEAVEFNSVIYKTESYIKNHIKNYYIFRLGGLIDQQRHPKGFHKNLSVQNSESPVNLVHIQDVSSIIYSTITRKIDFGVYNVCSPEHPSKKEYYGSFNQGLNYSDGNLGKIIDGSLISNHINYSYTSIYDFQSLFFSRKNTCIFK